MNTVQEIFAPDISNNTIDQNRVIVNQSTGKQFITGFKAQLLKRRLRLSIFKTALQHYGLSRTCFKVLNALKEKQQFIHGNSVLNKWVRASGKYFFYMYAPGFGKVIRRELITEEMNRVEVINVKPRLLRFAFFAITNKCPMRCEHCFEWDNINKKEVLSYEDLRQVVLKLKDAGISQLHMSGGEPMLRVDDIAKLALEFSNEIELWVVTSGFNVTQENVRKLKTAGVTGFEVSLDHYSKSYHDRFRGFENAYEWATNAIRFAREADMAVCASVCCTKEFTTRENLFQYIELAKQMDCSFIQLLEPKAVGHYQGKDINLSQDQLQLLGDFYEEMGQSKKYRNYPIVIYHGYYNRKVGCFSSGNRALYVDTKGEIMSCPFCHFSWGNMLRDDIFDVISKMRLNGCNDFGSAKV